MKPDLGSLQIYLNLTLHEAEVDVNCYPSDKIAVEFAKLEAVDPDCDVCVKGIRINSAINLFRGIQLVILNVEDERET